MLKNFIKLISKLINHSFTEKICNFSNKLYSYWIRNFFASCGHDLNVKYPVYLKGQNYMSIGDRFTSLQRLRIECWDSYQGENYSPKLIIGDNVNMNFNIHIGCINQVNIGNNVLFASNVFITDHQHGFVDNRDIKLPPEKRPLYSPGPVFIGNNVWIGENVAIMPNITIGDGCIVGANSVVTKSFPNNSVLAGVPAKLIKTLNIE